MRLSLVTALLFIFCLPALSQGVRPGNVYRVTVTSRYVLEDGELTSQFYAINQEIYDSLGRLHTEVDYDWETHYPNNYRWHFFDSLLLVRTEHYINEQLDRRVVFKYDEDSLVTEEVHYRLSGSDTLLNKRLIYFYDRNGRVVRTDALNSGGRRLYRARYSYDHRGTETRRRVRGRRGDHEDNIARLDRESEYDSLEMLASETVRLRMSDRSRDQYTRKYRYDEQQNIIGLIELDDKGNQVMRIEYAWQPQRNRLQRIIYFDEKDNIEKYIAKRYEIYRTSDRRQRVIDY